MTRTAVGLDRAGARVGFAGGEAHADLVVGADGVHSTLRRAVCGERAGPVITGRTAWRAVLEGGGPTDAVDTATESWGRGQRFGIVPMAAGRVYWYADTLEGRRARPESRPSWRLASRAGTRPSPS